MAERLPEAMDFHRQVSDAADAHLNLLGTPWLAAKILIKKDAALAQDAAKTFAKHITHQA